MEDYSGKTVRKAFDALGESYSAANEALKKFETRDLSRENERLNEMVKKLNTELQKNREEMDWLQGKHEALIRDFKHEMSSKRIALLGMSEKQHREYFAAGLEMETAKISMFQKNVFETMDKMSAELKNISIEEREPLTAELSSLRERISEQAKLARKQAEEAWQSAANQQSEELRALKNDPIEDSVLKAVRKFFQWETFLGLKIISAVGALLILFGVFTFGRYLYTQMSAVFQCAAIFVLGLALMGAGEVLYRKKWSGGFAVALTAGGSGVLFLGAALGYMTLGVFNMYVALAVCAAVSLLSFAASTRYNAQLVAVFALVGGYLPIISMENPIVMYGAIYFTILNLFALLVATRKNWRTTRFLGLFAGMFAELVMLLRVGRFYESKETTAVGAAIGIAFAAYLIIPVFGAWFTKTRIKAADIALLSLNVFFRFLLGLLWMNGGSRNYAFVAGFVAVCCIIMALITERKKDSGVPEEEEGSLRALFFVTSITFSALIILFAFDKAWFSAGWLIEAVGLLLYGIFKNRRRFNIAGTVIGSCCLYSFLAINVNYYQSPLFVWQYFMITATVVIIALVSFKVKKESVSVNVWLNILRGAALTNLWGYAVYVLYNPLRPMLIKVFNENAGSFAAILSVTLGFVFAFFLPKIRRMYNYGFQCAAIIIGVTSAVWLLAINAFSRGLESGNGTLNGVIFTLYILVNLIGIGWVNDFLRFMSGLKKLPLRWYPLLVSGWAVLLAAQNLVVQMSLKPSSLILTLLFGVTAFGWVVFGFVKRNGITRMSGLAMAFFAVIKLFVLDLYGLDTTWRIVSYFTAGVVLLAISFTYQWFNKRFQDK